MSIWVSSGYYPEKNIHPFFNCIKDFRKPNMSKETNVKEFVVLSFRFYFIFILLLHSFPKFPLTKPLYPANNNNKCRKVQSKNTDQTNYIYNKTKT